MLATLRSECLRLIYSLRGRLKLVGASSKRNRYRCGRIYLPASLIDHKVSYVTEEELNELVKCISRFEAIRHFSNFILNVKNGSRMFNVISRTWNPITGCTHLCIYCWARRFALTKLKNTRKYRFGFSPRFHEDELKAKFNGGMVFVTDMGDMFCEGVPDEWILKVIDHISKFPNTLFLFLTKNPERYKDFIDKLPENVVLGATIETNRDDMYLEKEISRAPIPSLRYKAMKNLNWHMKFISIEPILDFDLDIFVRWIKDINPFLVYVGYDNYNNKLPEPPLSKTLELIEKLSSFTLVIKKTIRPAWDEKTSLMRYET